MNQIQKKIAEIIKEIDEESYLDDFSNYKIPYSLWEKLNL